MMYTGSNKAHGITNTGDKPAYSLVFEVSLDDVALAVYRNVVYIQEIPANGEDVVELYNFWTSETGRPPPADKSLTVRVVLKEALWLDVEPLDSDDEGGDSESSAKGGEVWSPAGEVPGLPVERAVTLQLSSQ